MCDKCDGFIETIQIRHPYEYFNLIEQVKIIIEEGTLVLVEGNCNLEDIKKGSPFPDDILYHSFKCTKCSQRFSLSVETYHGSGGRWSVEI